MEADSLIDLMEQLLNLWVSGDACMTGMIAFLEAKGVVPPIEDDSDNAQLIDAMNKTVATICGLCRDNPTKLAECVKTISPSVAIE